MKEYALCFTGQQKGRNTFHISNFQNEQSVNLQFHLLQSLTQLFDLGLRGLKSGHQLKTNTRNDRVIAYRNTTTTTTNTITSIITYNNTNDDDDEKHGAQCLYL